MNLTGDLQHNQVVLEVWVEQKSADRADAKLIIHVGIINNVLDTNGELVVPGEDVPNVDVAANISSGDDVLVAIDGEDIALMGLFVCVIRDEEVLLHNWSIPHGQLAFPEASEHPKLLRREQFERGDFRSGLSSRRFEIVEDATRLQVHDLDFSHARPDCHAADFII